MSRNFALAIFTVLICASLAFAHEPEKAQCPQDRKTPQAPAEFLQMTNPLEVTEKRINKGKVLYQTEATPLQCIHCHGEKGDGTAEMGLEANPVARNFTCSPTMESISDGQMFWAIRNGVPKTSMPTYSDLKDWQIWVLIQYIRSLASSETH